MYFLWWQASWLHFYWCISWRENITAKLSVNLGEKETEVKLKQMLALDSCSFNTDSTDFIDALSLWLYNK